MSTPSITETDLTEAASSGALLALVLAHLNHRYRDAAAATRELIELAEKDRAFAESLADALCLYLQREDSSFEKAGFEFEHAMLMLSMLKRARCGPDLMRWIDRHRNFSYPSVPQESRFGLAIWTLMQIHPVDSSTFVRWWMERVEDHREGWLSRHFVEDAVPKRPERTPQH